MNFEVTLTDLLVVALCALVGVVFMVRSLFVVRSPQASVAWALALVLLPVIAVPFYIFFGARRFEGYRKLRRRMDTHFAVKTEAIRSRLKVPGQDPDLPVLAGLYAKLSGLPLLEACNARVYTKGEDFYKALHESIGRAKAYVFVEFFILRPDKVGTAFKQLLIEKAKEGVAIYLVIDRIGSSSLPSDFESELVAAGVQLRAFSGRNFIHRFQINFRNHRKIVVVDGKEALVGGFNIGEEYLTGGEMFSSWSDCQVHLEGSVVKAIEYTFLEDYFCCGGEVPELPNFESPVNPETRELTQVYPTGPADKNDRAAVLVQSLIQKADRRLWIATPYFVPDDAVLSALKVASLKGVDVRLLLPAQSDHYWVQLASEPVFETLLDAGVKVYHYKKGFNHQKTWVIDSDVAVVGTMNLDNRSMYLNFELSLVFFSQAMNQRLEQIFLRDIEGLDGLKRSQLRARPFTRKVLGHVARLFAPLL